MSLKFQPFSPFKSIARKNQSSVHLDAGENMAQLERYQMNAYETPDYNLKRKTQKSRVQQVDQKLSTPQVKQTPESNKMHTRSFSTRLQNETSIKKAQQQRKTLEESKQNALKSQTKQYKHNFQKDPNSISSLDLKKLTQSDSKNIQCSEKFANQESNVRKIKYVKRNDQSSNQASSASKQQLTANTVMDKSLSISQSVRSLRNTAAEEDSMLQTSEISFFNPPLQSQLQNSNIFANTGRVQRLFQKKTQQGKSPRQTSGGSKNRSLSKSFSEKKLRMDQRMIQHDLNKTQTPYITHENSKKHALIETAINNHNAANQTVGIDGMMLMQQETPSSSSNPSRFIDGDAFQDFMQDYKSPQKEVQRLENIQFKDIIKDDKIELNAVLDFLVSEEDKLSVFSVMASQGQLLELQQQLPLPFSYQYIDLISSVECKKERPRFFAQQLQVNLIIANTLVQIFTPPFLQRYSHKFRTVYTNIHQNLLLLIDQILNCCNANPKENLSYILLRKLTMKKLKSKQKSQRLTQFRQSNEVNQLIIKKICKSMITTTNNGQQSSTNLLETQLMYQNDYSQLSNEILEILRIHDTITIESIIGRLQFKEEIIKKKTASAAPSSPSKRSLTAINKHASPRASPRTAYLGGTHSPTYSNRSKKSDDSSKGGKTTQNKHSPGRKTLLVKPTFDYAKSNSKKQLRTIDKDSSKYDVIDSYNVTNSSQDQRNQQNINKAGGSQCSAFSLPESMLFMMTNSVDQNNHTSNKNIYSQFQTEELERLNQDKRKIKQKYEEPRTNKAGQISGNSARPPIANKQPNAPFMKQGSSSKSKVTITTASGIGTGTKNLQQRQALSRQKVSRENSSIALEQSIKDQLDPNKLGLSRESSAMSSKTSQVQHNKSTHDGKLNIPSPSQKKALARPLSRQVYTTIKDPQLIQNQRRKASQIQISKQAQSIKGQLSRPTSKQQQQTSPSKSTAKKMVIGISKDQSVCDLQSEIIINSVNCTPMKSIKSDATPSQSNQKPQKSSTLAQSGKKPSIGNTNKSLIKSKKPLPNNTSKTQQSSVNNSSSKIQGSERAKKETQMFQENISSTALNCIAFEINSLNEDEMMHTQSDFFSEQKAQLRNSILNQMNTITSQTPLCYSKDFEEAFSKGETRLDQLLFEMEDKDYGKAPAKMLQFGTLIDQFGCFDLKKEMEKLKQLDEEQKMQKRISLKVSHTNSQQESLCTNSPQTQTHKAPNNESPSKKIFLGEFDATKEDDYGMGNDLLLSRDSSRQAMVDDDKVAVEIFDFADYITQKTGMEDPFPDHQDDDEEVTPNNKMQKQSDQKHQKTEDEQKKRDDEEYQKLRALVKIPYLPPLDTNDDEVYTLVLDLDETLIHLECDDDAQEEEEQVYYLIRPGAIKFLNELSKYYELVVFTAAMPDYADWILDNVDRHNIIKHRLYRQHTTPHEDYAIKDLRNLGRPLERTIIIDNLAENFIHTTPENGIWVESWYDDMDDQVMDYLTPFLRDIVTNRVQDVRELLTKSTKENIIYRCLEEGKDIPPISQLLNPSSASS